MDPSGLRIGVPAITTRGMKEREVKKIVGWMDRALRSKNDESLLRELRKEVRELCKRYPLYR